MNKIYDLIILGAGPAGITAHVYAARKKLDFLVITKDIGGQAAWSGDIENYTGFQFVTGPELASKFEDHMSSFQTEIKMPEDITDIQKDRNIIKVVTDKSEYFTRTLIVATGKRPRELSVAGESEFKNKGVTYCATCDGPLFNDKNVAIIGSGNSGLDAVLQLMKISPQVHLIDVAEKCTGDPVMVEKVREASNVKIWNKARVKKITGDTFVRGMDIESNGETVHLDVEGVFVEVGLSPNSEFARILNKNKQGEIIVDCHNRTNIDGIFAAGDATDVPEKQIIIACGEGAKACLTAFRYLSTHKFKEVPPETC